MKTKVIFSIAIATLLVQAQASDLRVENAVANPNQAVTNIVPVSFKKKHKHDDEDEEKDKDEEKAEGAEGAEEDQKDGEAEPIAASNMEAITNMGAFVFDGEGKFIPISDGFERRIKVNNNEEEDFEEDNYEEDKEDNAEEDNVEENNINAQEVSGAAPTAVPAVGASASASVKASVSTGVSISFPSPSISGNLPKFSVGPGKVPAGNASSMGGSRPTSGARIASPKSSGTTVRASVGATASIILFAAYSLL